MRIREFRPGDEEAVVSLWVTCELTRPWNDPYADIERKLADSPALLLVGEEAGSVIGTVMAGYDGHRGWINYLAVHPSRRGSGFGRALMDAAEDNEAACAFYQAIGYQRQPLVDFGKRLIRDD
ncbi:MAG: GNAT family acetyltransferase [Chloroflexota bacterium]